MTIARLNGIDINYEVHGAGTPLVLAHGYTANLDMWRMQVDAFSAKYRLVIYDTRGHGKTTAPTDPAAYGMAEHYVPDQLALMDHLGIDKAYVGGLSMGGMIAQEFALRHPERVSALLLCDTGPGFAGAMRDPGVAARFEQFRAMMSGVARSKGMSAVIDAMRASPMWADRAAIGERTPAAIEAYIENLKSMSVDGYLGGASAMQTWAGTVDRLHAITAPTLVLVGEQDNLLPASRVIHGKIAGSRFALLRNCGHGSAVWRPRAFSGTVLDFLADVDARKPVAGEITVE